jgi:DNA polymerase I-like protein with 3'-5' exonuclease and polymerase domains
MTKDELPEVDTTKIWVVDFETDNNNDENRAFSASPFYEGNGIVNGCWAVVDISREDGEFDVEYGVFNPERYRNEVPKEIGRLDYLPWLLCGHNVRYDLHFLRMGGPDADYYPKLVANGDITLWDTQFAEYLLTGQAEKMVPLNKLAEKYGLGAKHDEVKEMWDAGYKTREIDSDVLDDYVEQDVRLTTHIALQQIASAFESGMLDFILFQMRSLFVVSEYEFNGMFVEYDTLDRIKRSKEIEEALCAERFYSCFIKLADNKGILKNLAQDQGSSISDADELLRSWIDIDSPDKIKRLVFGGPLELDIKVEDGVYKSGKKKGQTKHKKVRYTDTWPTVVSPGDVDLSNLTPKGKEKAERGQDITFKDVSLDETAIQNLLRRGDLPPGVKELLESAMEYRDCNKIRTTYCQQVEDFMFSHDKCVHCNLNVDNTPTGRLTSSKPNMQNMPSKEDSEFKKIFSSRFPFGKIGTVDFKQLEVVGLAYLTDDPVLVDDLENGRDIHYETGREAGLWSDPSDMEPDTRKEIKRLNFGSIYGAGKKKLASQGTMNEATVSKCLEALKSRYSTAFGGDYIHNLEEVLDLHAYRLGRTDDGMRRYGNYLKQPTGRLIWIETQSSSSFGSFASSVWPYTCLRNYPVQSLAADIVSVARVVFYDTIQEMEAGDEILMVNEVHDEIVFDIKNGWESAFKDIVEIVENRLPDVLSRVYNLPRRFDLPLVLEVGIGDSWKDAK